jgi:hypothetical protein
MTHADLDDLPVAELKSLAKAARITNAARLRKHELIEALRALPALPDVPALNAPASVPAPEALAAPQAALGSSSSTTAAAPVFGPDGDPGLPIPERYGIDRAVLLVQDPHHIYVWWELTGGVLERARGLLAEPGAGVLLLHGPDGVEQRLVDLAAGNHYLSVRPGSRYHLELALRAADGRLVVMLATNSVETPADAPSPRLDVAWMSVDETFNTLLDRAGLEEGQPSSAERYRLARLQQRLWQDLEQPTDSSLGLQVRPGAPQAPLPPGAGLSSLSLSSLGLSSFSLSSAHLGSHTLARGG